METAAGDGSLGGVLLNRCLEIAEKEADCVGESLEGGVGLCADGGRGILGEDGLDLGEKLGYRIVHVQHPENRLRRLLLL